MKRLLVLCIFLLAAPIAGASFPVDLHITWTDPVERTDGQPFDADTEAQGYALECTKSPTDAVVYTSAWAKEVGVTENWFPGAFDGPGTYTCRILIRDQDGRSSVWSDPATKKVTGNPNAPVIMEMNLSR